jgi:uncharacterized protein (DUF2062 family)
MNDPQQVETEKEKLPARFRRLVYINFIDPLVMSRHPPAFDALGVSLGLVIGFVIPLGGHLLVLALLRVFFRFNYLVAAGFTLVINPLNAIPLYYGYYWLGSIILGKSILINFQVFQNTMNPIMDKSYFWEYLSAFLDLGWEILIRWLTAAVLIAVVFGIAGYALTYRIQKRRCKRAAQIMGMKYEEFLEHLQQRAPGDNA